MDVSVKLDPDSGNYVLEDRNQAEYLFQAIVNSFSEEELIKMERCPLCRKKTAFKLSPISINRHMVEILFEMRRVMVADPDQHGFVYMREEVRGIKEKQQSYSMINGSQQNHKMCYLGLVTQIGADFEPLPPEARNKLQAAYKLTQKGLSLINGKSVSPWTIHRRLGRTTVTDEDKLSSGTLFDAKEMTYEDYVNMSRNAEVEHLEMPERLKNVTA